MEIILKEDIIGLGFKNDIVNVKSGYGRNYLIPTGKAVIASPSAKKVLAENLKQQAHKLAKILENAEKEAAALNGVSLEIKAKVSATGVLYGSVNTSTIVEELAKKGITVDRKKVVMKDIKTVGEYAATVIFHKEVSVEIPVTVLAEGGEFEEKKAEAPKAEVKAEVEAEPVVEAPEEEEEAQEEAAE